MTVASRRITTGTTSPAVSAWSWGRGQTSGAPATRTGGRDPRRATTCSHAAVRTLAMPRVRARPGSPSSPRRPAYSPSTRRTVVSDAPPAGPNSSTWAVNASTPVRHDAPEASAATVSLTARPRSRPGTNPGRASTSRNILVIPTRSASNRGSTTPA